VTAFFSGVYQHIVPELAGSALVVATVGAI